MIKTVDQMIDDILEHEGGYVDDPNDRGGATNYGVSLRYARNKGLVMDLDNDGDIDAEDIRLVTPELARQLYKEDFLEQPKLDQLPPELQPQLFDMSVNHGPKRAIILLQEACNEYGEFITADGIMGLQTLTAAIKIVNTIGWWKLNNMVVKQRIRFYEKIVMRDPSQDRFIDGWIKRAESFWISFDDESGKWIDKPSEEE